MPLNLPTDTAHLRLETRQYELFNRPIAQGIPRRTMAIAAGVGGLWALVMAIFGVNPISQFGPMLWVLPPFVVVYFGTRKDESGRMALLAWYDAILARFPQRRRVLRNPMMSVADYKPAPIRITTMTELSPRNSNQSLTSSAAKGEA